MISADARFQRCLGIVVGPAIEGGFVDNSSDPGGATNHGITLATLAHWRGHPCTVSDVEALSLSEAAAIYRALYWSVVGGDGLPAGLDLMAFDCAVNQGPHAAAIMLQEAVGASPDGHVGPATLAAAAAEDAAQAIHAMSAARLESYEHDADWPTFKRGWTARLNTITAQALAWVSGGLGT